MYQFVARDEVLDVSFKWPLFQSKLATTLKERLSVRTKLPLDLTAVNDGFKKKMRFTVVTLCPGCQVANHVEISDQDDEPIENCDICHNDKVFVAKTKVFTIVAAPGTLKGDDIYFPGEGDFGPHGIRGDIVITCFDVKHDHFLRVYNDIVVGFRINQEEAINGVTRYLHLVVPVKMTVLLKTQPGVQIQNNDVMFVDCLGLPEITNPEKRGKLIVFFIIKQERSMCPIELNKVHLGMLTKRVVSRKRKATDQEPGGRPHSRMKMLHESHGRDEDLEMLTNAEVEERPSLNVKNLSFLDRLIYTRAIPLTYNQNVLVDSIPMVELELLWRKKFFAKWWRRIEIGNSKLGEPDYFLGSYTPQTQVKHPNPCRVPVIDLKDDSLDIKQENFASMMTQVFKTSPECVRYTIRPVADQVSILQNIRKYMLLR